MLIVPLEKTPSVVIKFTRGLDRLPSMLALLVGIILFLLQINPVYIGFSAALAYFLGVILDRLGIYPGSIIKMLGSISGYRVIFICTTILGLLVADWQSVLAFYLGIICAIIITIFIRQLEMRLFGKEQIEINEYITETVKSNPQIYDEILDRDSTFRYNLDNEKRKLPPWGMLGRQQLINEEFELWKKVKNNEITDNHAVELMTDLMEQYYKMKYPLR